MNSRFVVRWCRLHYLLSVSPGKRVQYALSLAAEIVFSLTFQLSAASITCCLEAAAVSCRFHACLDFCHRIVRPQLLFLLRIHEFLHKVSKETWQICSYYLAISCIGVLHYSASDQKCCMPRAMTFCSDLRILGAQGCNSCSQSNNATACSMCISEPFAHHSARFLWNLLLPNRLQLL